MARRLFEQCVPRRPGASRRSKRAHARRLFREEYYAVVKSSRTRVVAADGVHGIWTGTKAALTLLVNGAFGVLWQATEGFRALKSGLAFRSVVYRARRRVKAHIAICIAAFSLQCILQSRDCITYGARRR